MNQFQKIFDAQKALFAAGVTRTYEWRVDQLDRIARIHLRDGGIGWRERGPEEPAERVDEARGSTRATLPRQNRPQGHDLSRALRRGAHHRPLQRTPAPAD